MNKREYWDIDGENPKEQFKDFISKGIVPAAAHDNGVVNCLILPDGFEVEMWRHCVKRYSKVHKDIDIAYEDFHQCATDCL